MMRDGNSAHFKFLLGRLTLQPESFLGHLEQITAPLWTWDFLLFFHSSVWQRISGGILSVLATVVRLWSPVTDPRPYELEEVPPAPTSWLQTQASNLPRLTRPTLGELDTQEGSERFPLSWSSSNSFTTVDNSGTSYSCSWAKTTEPERMRPTCSVTKSGSKAGNSLNRLWAWMVLHRTGLQGMHLFVLILTQRCFSYLHCCLSQRLPRNVQQHCVQASRGWNLLETIHLSLGNLPELEPFIFIVLPGGQGMIEKDVSSSLLEAEWVQRCAYIHACVHMCICAFLGENLIGTRIHYNLVGCSVCGHLWDIVKGKVEPHLEAGAGVIFGR